MLHPRITYHYGSHADLQYAPISPNTAVLVFTDGHTPWANPGYGEWLQVVAMDMVCNRHEQLVCLLGRCLVYTPLQLERLADYKIFKIWRGNDFPFRPFLSAHAKAIYTWLDMCETNHNITDIRIHCVYGKQRSRAAWAVCNELGHQGNLEVYRKLRDVMV